MPNNKGHFTLVSYTSGVVCGAALYQEQRSMLRIVGYNSKKLPPAAIRYTIIELELCGLAVSHYLSSYLKSNLQGIKILLADII